MFGGIKIPQIVPDAQLIKLPPETRERYIHNIIWSILELNKDLGITVAQIEQNTPFSRKSIGKHLYNFVATNEAYFRKIGRNKLYFPNSHFIHSVRGFTIEIENKELKAHLIDNPFGKYVYLQEITKEQYGEKTGGGLIIPLNHFSEFKDFILNIESGLKRFRENESKST